MADERSYKDTIKASEILAKIENGEDVEYDGYDIIEGNLDISDLELPEEDGKLVINSKISIINSRFDGFVDFSNTVFKKEIGFKGTIFDGLDDQGRSTDFRSAAFSGYAGFRSERS